MVLWARASGRPASTGFSPRPRLATTVLQWQSASPGGQQLVRPQRRASAAATRQGDSSSSWQGGEPAGGRQPVVPGKTQLSELQSYDEIVKLVQLLPPGISGRLEAHPKLLQLVEVVMDLGRPPLARFPSGDERLSADPVSEEDLQLAVAQVGDFGGDNRAGIDKTLHRISCIRNRSGRIVGLTCRVGRAIAGSAAMVDDLVQRNCSVLMLGRPGVGKTTAIREISRKLADEYHKRVVIVDTSNEIGGDGDIPHPGIGNARRMQVPHPDQQHRVMIEAVENHMPEVIVIDEIGTEAEALAARTIAQRGVQLVATAHGNALENVLKNPSLNDLVGGISSVTLGDEEAKRRGVQKSILEREAPPTFDVAVEMVSREQWRVHMDVGLAVDKLLSGREPSAEVRERDESGKIWSWPEDVASDSEAEEAGLPSSSRSSSNSSRGGGRRGRRQGSSGGEASSSSGSGGAASAGWGDEGAGGELHPLHASITAARRALVDPRLGTYAATWDAASQATAASTGRESLAPGEPSQRPPQQQQQQPVPSASSSSASSFAPSSSCSAGSSQAGKGAAVAPLRLYAYGVDAGSILSVGSALKLEGRLELCDRLEEADAVLALRTKLKASAWVKEAARVAGIPVFTIKSGGVGDVVKALRALLGIDPSPGGLFADGAAPVAADPKISNSRNSRAEASIALVAAAAMGRQGKRQGASAVAAAVAQQAQQATDAAQRDALEEVRLAVEQIVIPRGQPIELLPREPAVLEEQVKLLLTYRLPFELVGPAGNQRLRVMPPGYGTAEGSGAAQAAAVGSQS